VVGAACSPPPVSPNSEVGGAEEESAAVGLVALREELLRLETEMSTWNQCLARGSVHRRERCVLV
jgi:hypothetical protein